MSAHINVSVCRAPPIDEWVRESEHGSFHDSEPPTTAEPTFHCTTCNARFPTSEQIRHLFTWTCPICQLIMHTHSKDLHISTTSHRGPNDWYCSPCDRTLHLAARNQHENSTLHLANVQQGIIDDLHITPGSMDVQQEVIDGIDTTRGTPTAVVPKAVGGRKEITFVCTFCDNGTFPAKEVAKHGPTWQCRECGETIHRYYKADHKASRHPDLSENVGQSGGANPTAGSTPPSAPPIVPTTRLVKIDPSAPRLQGPIILGSANVTLRPTPRRMVYKPDDRYTCPTCKIIMAVNKRTSHERGQKHLEAVRVAEAMREEKQLKMAGGMNDPLLARFRVIAQMDKVSAVAGGENGRAVGGRDEERVGMQTAGKLLLSPSHCDICDIKILDGVDVHSLSPQHLDAALHKKRALLGSVQSKPVPRTTTSLSLTSLPATLTAGNTSRRDAFTARRATNVNESHVKFQESTGSAEIMEERKLDHGGITSMPGSSPSLNSLTRTRSSYMTDIILRNPSAYHCVLCGLTVPADARDIHESSLSHIRAIAVATARPTRQTKMFSCNTCKKTLPATVHPFHRSGPWTCWLCQVTVHMDWIGAHLVSDGHVAREEDYMEDK